LIRVAYFRLAQNIHPLLAASFGKANFTLYAHEELAKEFSRTRVCITIQLVFLRKDYVANRASLLQIGRKERKGIEQTFEFMWAHVQSGEFETFTRRRAHLATASELSLRMVSDDQDLLGMANDYGVHADTL